MMLHLAMQQVDTEKEYLVLAIDQIQVFTQAEKLLSSRNNLRCYLYYWK